MIPVHVKGTPALANITRFSICPGDYGDDWGSAELEYTLHYLDESPAPELEELVELEDTWDLIDVQLLEYREKNYNTDY